MKTTKVLFALVGLMAMLTFAKANAKSVNAAAAPVVVSSVFQPRLPPPPPHPPLPFFHHRHYRHHYHYRHHRRW